jgi:hypothetical protein
VTDSGSRGAGRNAVHRAALRLAPSLRRLAEEHERLQKRESRLERRLARERRAVRELEERLQAVESGAAWTPDGTRTELGYLFIVTYGRSGSTLLQGLLNAIPGYLIRGENRIATYRLYQFCDALASARERFGRTEALSPRDSWYGIDEYRAPETVARLRAIMLDCLLRPAPDTRVVGFKEIRWFQSDFQEHVAFLERLFPGARFVINTRDHAHVAKSHWWSKMEEAQALATLAGHEKQLDELASRLGPKAYRVHYDDYVADHAVLRGLFDWLGESWDPALVDAVFDVKHSF